jgi:hypothetical protein
VRLEAIQRPVNAMSDLTVELAETCLALAKQLGPLRELVPPTVSVVLAGGTPTAIAETRRALEGVTVELRTTADFIELFQELLCEVSEGIRGGRNTAWANEADALRLRALTEQLEMAVRCRRKRQPSG